MRNESQLASGSEESKKKKKKRRKRRRKKKKKKEIQNRVRAPHLVLGLGLSLDEPEERRHREQRVLDHVAVVTDKIEHLRRHAGREAKHKPNKKKGFKSKT